MSKIQTEQWKPITVIIVRDLKCKCECTVTFFGTYALLCLHCIVRINDDRNRTYLFTLMVHFEGENFLRYALAVVHVVRNVDILNFHNKQNDWRFPLLRHRQQIENLVRNLIAFFFSTQFL